MNSRNSGFTLIELLVVVLIIGILASVALPKYQLAVAKSRYMNIMSAAKTFKNAMEVYYMANGQYPMYWADVDIEYPGCVESRSVRYMLGCDSFAADLFASSNENLTFWDTQSVPNYDKATVTSEIGSTSSMEYIIWLDHSTHPGKQECSSSIKGLCKSLGF